MRSRPALMFTLSLVLVLALPGLAGEAEDEFWEAARQGDLEQIRRLHQSGVDPNAATKYGATALSFACDKGHLEIVRYLIANGADVNAEDTFYSFSPLGWALFQDNPNHIEIAKLLLANGAKNADRALLTGIRNNRPELVRAALDTKQINQDHVAQALTLARETEGREALVELLEQADVPAAEKITVELSAEALEPFVGTYKNNDANMTLEVTRQGTQLFVQTTGQPKLTLEARSEDSFQAVEEPQVKISFRGRGGTIEGAVAERGSRSRYFSRVTPGASVAEAEEPPATEPEPTPQTRVVQRKPAQNWPSFRGPQASGIADGQGAPMNWDLASGKNVRWKTEIAGLANSSPIVWGKRVFVTTAVSSGGDNTIRSGLYGDVDSVDDVSVHEFKLIALNLRDGQVAWERTVAKTEPQVKRHLKSTQANSTPVTDGKRVVALFGTIGVLACYDMQGKELWTKRLGAMDSGWFYDKSYQWGHASSPVIYRNHVIVQADLQSNSFIAAYRLKDGKEVWRTARDEVPTWGTPTVYLGKNRDELITNGTTIRGYNPANGKELWRLGPNSEVTVATPIIAHDLFYVTAGYPPVRPVYAIRPGSNGDLSGSTPGESPGAGLAWSHERGGTYMPTPIVYGDYLYTCANNGRLTCYSAKTGERVYRARVGDSGSFSASPIAADGRLYFTEETGDIFVVQAGPLYVELAKNSMDAITMSTPAISDGLMIVRTLRYVYGLGESSSATAGSAR